MGTRQNVRGIIGCLGLAALVGALGVFVDSARADAPVKPPSDVTKAAAAKAPPTMEVMFVLDTTGSMSGLIEGAKRKIWAIASELSSAKPRPVLRIGLVAYRDRGDAYVVKQFPLTTDLDAVYEQLRGLSAHGGGDWPESVNAALNEAVENAGWSTELSVYRTVFLVGDAPPHLDYEGDVPYTAVVARAAKRGIVINTVQCGNEGDTREVWSKIARTSNGTYAAIEQGGGMMAVATPMDREISKLNEALAKTVLPYGSASEQGAARGKAARASAATAEESSSRLSYLKKGGGAVITGGGDLLDALASSSLVLEGVPAREMPEALRGKSAKEQKAEIERRTKERVAIKAKLDKLVDERDAYVKAEEKKRAATGTVDGFDTLVKAAVKTQAAKATGVTYAD